MRRVRCAGRTVLWALTAAGLVSLSGCNEFVIDHPTATPVVSAQPSLPPIGYNHRYGNNPVAAADGLAFERSLYAGQVFWEVGLRAEPQLAGFVDRTKPENVVAARAAMTSLIVVVATERLNTIRGMLAFSDAQQQQYCLELLDHFRATGYSHLSSAQVAVYFTERDEHATLVWKRSSGYVFTIYDGNLRGNLTPPPGPVITPLPAPG